MGSLFVVSCKESEPHWGLALKILIVSACKYYYLTITLRPFMITTPL